MKRAGQRYEPPGMHSHLAQPWKVAISGWVDHERQRGALSAASLRTRTEHLRHLGRHLGRGPYDVTADELATWFAAQRWARETRRARRVTLRVFYAWGVQAGHVEESPARFLPHVRAGTSRPRPASERVYAVALATAAPRERLMLRLAAELGLRRGEVAQVHTSDIIEDLAGWSLVVNGKGDRERIMPLTPSLAGELRAASPGWVFPGRVDGHLSARWVGTVVSRLMPEGLTMHTLRHRFASRAYKLEPDLAAVQDLLGHASPVTTRVYVVVPNERLRHIVERVERVA